MSALENMSVITLLYNSGKWCLKMFGLK